MEYRFQNNLPDTSSLRAIRKTAFSSVGDKKDYHPHYEIYFCKEHRLQNVIINGQTAVLDTPSIIFSAPFSIHSMFPADGLEPSLERYVIYFGEKLLSLFSPALLPDNFSENFSNCIFPLNDEQCRELEKTALNMLSDDISETERALSFALFVNMLDRCVPSEKRIAYGRTSYYIIDVLEYIYKSIGTSISSDGIAEHFHVSRAKLDRDFRRFVGQSVRGAITDCRLACACDMLASTTRQIKDIAAECGFESEYYFYYFFKKGMGKTPLAWRKENKKS